MIIQVVYTFDFFILALESAHLRGEEICSIFFLSHFCFFFFPFYSDFLGQQ